MFPLLSFAKYLVVNESFENKTQKMRFAVVQLSGDNPLIVMLGE